MKIDLVMRGAPKLPPNFRYRVHIHEVYETAVDVNVSILEKTRRKIFKIIPVSTERVVVSSTVRINDDTQYDTTDKHPLVAEAETLYKYAMLRGRINN